VGSAVYAADLTIETPALAAAGASGEWDGPFVGVFGGYAKGSADVPVDFDLKGFLLGVDAGANFTMSGGVVAGVVGDIAWSGVSDDDAFVPPGAFDVSWAGSVRARLGFDAGAFMPYLTAGIAVADADLTASDGTDVGSNMHFGWTAGAGVAFKATDKMSIDLGYRYSDYGAQTYGVTDYRFATHQATIGLNWQF
jgi:opacity protein-like surface antigen